MRPLALMLVFAACAHTSEADAERSAADRDARRFCSAEAVTHMTSVPEFMPWFEPQVESAAWRALLEHVRSGTAAVDALSAELNGLISDARITDCPSRDRLMSAR